MVRVRPLALSLLVHAVLLALVGFARRHPGPMDEPIEVELAAEEPDVEPEPTDVEPESAALQPAPTTGAPRPAGRPRAAPAPRAARAAAAGGVTGEPSPDGLDLGWSLGAVGGGAAGGAGGQGGGTGGGAQATRRARAASRSASKARPPRLVYPKRVRDERDGDVFVAVVTIDEGGWVVGVRLVQGVSLYADQKALDAAWRLHYDPALDDAGRPIRARVVQRFMIE